MRRDGPYAEAGGRGAGAHGGACAVGYLRRSTDRQEQSIPDQRKAVEQYAREQKLKLVHYYIDDAISGTSTIGRRAFQQMVADAQKRDHGWDTIIVYDVKRFGRVDNDEAGYYRHLLRLHGVEIRYVSENFTGDGTDDLIRPVKQWQARQESKDLSKVTIRGLLSRSAGGWWMGGVPPLGYDLRYENDKGELLFVLRHLPDGSKQLLDKKGHTTRKLDRGESLSLSKRDRCRVVPGAPDRVAVLKRIFRMYVDEGKGFKAVADTLNREGVPAPRGTAWARIYTGKWADSTVRAILVNPLYTGDMVWNRRTDGRFHKISGGRAVERGAVHGARLVPNGVSDWITVRDAHPALVSRDVFERARQRREGSPWSKAQRGRPPVGGWHGARSRFILSGIVVCSACENRYQGCTRQKGRRRKNGLPVKTFYYACGGYIRGGTAVCNAPMVGQAALEDAVIRAVLEFYRPYLADGGRQRLEAAVREHLGDASKDVAAARKRILADQKRLDGVTNNLLDNITRGNREFVDRRLKELSKERDQLTHRMVQLDHVAVSQTVVRETIREAAEFLGRLEPTLRKGVPEEKRVALRHCVEKVDVEKDGKKTAVHIRRLPVTGARSVELRAEVADSGAAKKGA